jgi:hypothetical protein
MNKFLKDIGVTFRRDPSTLRPRANKLNSQIDKYQKSIGEYYYIDSVRKPLTSVRDESPLKFK